MTDLPYARQDIGPADRAAVLAALDAPHLTQGPGVERFEAALCAVTGARFAVAVSSGTAALHAAYAVAGLGPGDRVVVPAITFPATANAARYVGVDPWFADVDPATGLLALDDVAARAPAATRVVVPVHFAGAPAAPDRTAALAADRGWLVIEDAAHALGARYARPDGSLGTVGDCAASAMCCFSFHAVKHVTTGEGGAVTTNDPALAAALRRFRTHGITRDRTALTRDDGPWYYEQLDLGFNYRLTDLQCALGVAQLGRLQGFLARRRALAARYVDRLRAVPDVTPVVGAPLAWHALHLFVVAVPAARRRAVFEYLRTAGIGVNVHYVPVYRHPYYQETGWAGATLPGAERYYGSAITLPLFPAMADADVDRVVDTLRDALTAP